MNQFTKMRMAWALALFLVVSIHGAAAQEQSFSDANCAFTPPSGWQKREIKDQPALVAAYGDATRTLLVLVNERGKAAEPFNDNAVNEFDKGMDQASNGRKDSGKYVQFAGFQTYERIGAAVMKGKKVSTLVLAIPTGDGIYLLEALSTKNEAADDTEIRQSINSFHFLRPPGPPRQPPSASYRAGYLLGQSFVGLAILGLILWAISKLVSRRPPPPPTGFSGPYPYPQAGFSPSPTAPPPFPPVGSSPPPLPSLPPPPPPY